MVGPSGTPGDETAVWVDHRPHTFLGMAIPSMPNMFTVFGPHQPFGNTTRSIEHAVGVVYGLLQFCHDQGYSYVEATQAAADECTEHVVQRSKGALSNEVDSWMTGVNKDGKGKTLRNVARYAGPVQEFRRRCEECKKSDYRGLVFALLSRPLACGSIRRTIPLIFVQKQHVQGD